MKCQIEEPLHIQIFEHLFTSSARKCWFGLPEGSKNQMFDFACVGLSFDFGRHFHPSLILVLALCAN